MSYIVICEDGQQRHDGRFDTRAEAKQWANWGHCCTNYHRVINPDLTESDLAAIWTDTP